MDGVSAKRVDQTQDLWGNLTRMKVYEINSSTVRRQYDQTYLNDSAHTQRYIRNRMIDSKVTEAGVQTTLVTNVYDNYGPPVNNPIVNVINIRQFDSATSTPSLTARGIVTSSTTLGGLTYLTQIDVTGNVLQSYSSNGVGASSNVNSNTNYAAPSSVTVGSLTSSFQYAADLLPTQATGPNGDSAATVYDSYARPTSTTSKTGAVTYFNYTPTAVITYTNPNINSVGRVTRTTLDGFGRPVMVETGTGTYSNSVITLSAWVSIMSTEYAPCGCSPLGKLSRTSRPYAVNGTVYWTTYTYDGIGRTKTVKAPDGASTTTYGYAGAVVTVTDPAGKWKTFTTDAPGNLTQVLESDPNLGNVSTYYH